MQVLLKKLHIIFKSSLLMYFIFLLLGVISVLAFAPFNQFYLIYIIFLFINYYLNTVVNNLKQTFIIGYIFGIGYFSIQLYWAFYSLYFVIDTGLIIATIAYLFFIGFLALYIALGFFTFQLLKTKYLFVNITLLFPSIWTISEWFRGWLFTGFPWCDISYSQVNINFLKGIFPIVGSYGVSFLILHLIGVINCVFLKFNKKNISYGLMYILGVIIIGNFLQQVQYTKPYGKPVTVALIQGNILQNAKWQNNAFLEIYKNLISNVKTDLTIIPETAISEFAEYLPHDYLNSLLKTTILNHTNLIMGIPKYINNKQEYVNAALLLGDNKQQFYAKSHLVPYGEYIPFKSILSKVYEWINLPKVGFTPGAKQQLPIVIVSQKLAFNICYENGFNTEIANNSIDSTILVNISDMVWYGNSIAQYQHLQISQARALENQRYFLQDTNTGLTAIINPHGVINATLVPFTRDILISMIYGYFGTTIFQKVGNYLIIGICFVIVLLVLVLRGLLLNKQI